MAMVPKPDATSLFHGGDLTAARQEFPNAPQPFIDLSTGINPHPYPLPQLSLDIFARLPQNDALERLLAAAANAYGAPSPDHVVAAPGTQILLPTVAAVSALTSCGLAKILGPTYAEHAGAAYLAGHSTITVSELAELEGADLAVVVNPNNPDGRMVTRSALIAIANKLRAGGLLVVDEAFADVASPDASLAREVAGGNIVVLRSFGKFFGLAGLRLGFALAAPAIATVLRSWLGPWAVSGPAIAIGEAALGDAGWAQATRAMLHRDAQRLEEMLSQAGLEIVGGTSLFRLTRTPAASELYHQLGRAGIFVRRFTEQPDWLRFGLPGAEGAWSRLGTALAAFRQR